MTENFYTSENYKPYITDRSAYGGVISDFDFNGHPTMKDIAARIASDLKFDSNMKMISTTKKRVQAATDSQKNGLHKGNNTEPLD